MKPNATPFAIEYVNGISSAVSAAGTASVASSHGTSTISRSIRHDTYSSAGAVA